MSALAQLALACMRSLRDADPTATLATVGRWLDAVARVLATPGGSERIVVLWSYVLLVTDVPTAQLAALVGTVGPDAEASLMSTGHKLRSEGRLEGRAEALLRQLTKRFGPPPTAIVERVRTATVPDLDRWTDAILSAETLDAVFAH